MSQGQYKMREFAWEEAPGQVFSNLYKIAISRSGTSIGGVEMYPDAPIYYYATNRRVKIIKSQSPVILLLILLQKLYQAFMRLGKKPISLLVGIKAKQSQRPSPQRLRQLIR